jgi:hypothetical protein
VDEIFQKDLWRQTIVNAPGDPLHLRKMLEHQVFTPGCVSLGCCA